VTSQAISHVIKSPSSSGSRRQPSESIDCLKSGRGTPIIARQYGDPAAFNEAIMPAFITFGRVLFAVLFIYSGATKLFGIQATTDFIATKITIPALLVPYTSQLETMTGMPTPQLLAVAVGAFEVIAGLMIALNFGARFFAILLIFFVSATIFYFHDFWNQSPPDNARTLMDALKNLSIIGALFMIAGYGRVSRPAEAAYGDM
jgi:putative oxidoreductase